MVLIVLFYLICLYSNFRTDEIPLDRGHPDCFLSISTHSPGINQPAYLLVDNRSGELVNPEAVRSA